ncbi:MAG: cytochrome c [Woeseiaceae bacterium]|nr:cytochrome c [Woeseiaceae bacterium]
MSEVLARGRTVYEANCAACHQRNGQGLPGAFPPLAQSDYLDRDREQVLRVALLGLSGPITVNGVQYNGVMPSMAYLSDEELAAAMTYVFNAWGNSYAAVSANEIAALRE